MAEVGFPGQHTTTTVTDTKVERNLRFDPSYIKTLPGILKIVQIVVNLLGFICIEVSGYPTHSRGSYFNFVAMTGFWFTGLLLFFYLIHLVEKFYKMPWITIEMGFCTIWIPMYLIASCLAATQSIEAYTAAAFFGFCGMVAYAGDAFLKYKAFRRGDIAQGQRTIQRESNITTPVY